MARLTLAEQIAQLEDAGPKDYDPEDAYNGAADAPEGEEDGTDPTDNAAREHYVDVGPSALRKLHDSVADPKYEGVKTSRKHIFDDDDSDEDAIEENPLDAALGTDDGSDDGQSDGGEDSEGEEGSEQGDDVGDNDQGDHSDTRPSPPPKKVAFSKPAEKSDDLAATLKRSRDADRLKGKAVSRQLALWDTLVDARIRLQKGASITNRLPHPNKLPAFVASEDGLNATHRMLDEALRLSEDIATLQALLYTNQDVDVLPRKRRKTGTEDAPLSTTDYQSQVIEASQHFSQIESSVHPHLIQTLQKWSNKIQSVSPSALLPSKKTSFHQQAAPKSVVDLIDDAVGEGRAKAVGRTRVRRNGLVRIGEGESTVAPTATEGLFVSGKGDKRDEAPEEGDAEIFDDTDFYQQLLRDVIDSKTGKDGLAADSWEGNKTKKTKKKVDTKASKGRKLRYEVHEKLQNFMVPVPIRGAWHEEQIDELFASLLGKGFGGEMVDVNAMDVDQPVVEAAPVDLGGLRVF